MCKDTSQSGEDISRRERPEHAELSEIRIRDVLVDVDQILKRELRQFFWLGIWLAQPLFEMLKFTLFLWVILMFFGVGCSFVFFTLVFGRTLQPLLPKDMFPEPV